jgi:hypothetical protein
MAYYQETSDANFFSLVHHVLESHKPTADADRRERNRHDYTCRQFIAPYVGGRLPKQNDFRAVECQDLSPTGFSFVEAELPKHEHLIVALGKAPYIFVSAEIVHSDLMEINGKAACLVGCRFLSRIKGVVYGYQLGDDD